MDNVIGTCSGSNSRDSVDAPQGRPQAKPLPLPFPLLPFPQVGSCQVFLGFQGDGRSHAAAKGPRYHYKYQYNISQIPESHPRDPSKQIIPMLGLKYVNKTYFGLFGSQAHISSIPPWAWTPASMQNDGPKSLTSAQSAFACILGGPWKAYVSNCLSVYLYPSIGSIRYVLALLEIP